MSGLKRVALAVEDTPEEELVEMQDKQDEFTKIMMELMLEGRILVVDSEEGECFRLSDRELKKLSDWYYAQEEKDRMVYLMGAETIMFETKWPMAMREADK